MVKTFRTTIARSFTRMKTTFFQLLDTYGVGVFAVGTGLLIALIILAQFLKKPQAQEVQPEPQVRRVLAQTFGEVGAEEKAVGVVKNLSSLTLVAGSNGPVSAIKVVEGQKVATGQVLAYQSSAYGAGNAATVQRQIAQKSYDLAETSLQNTVDVVAKNRELADKNRDNTEELRRISEQSLSETRDAITLTEQIISKIETDIRAEEAGANNPSTIQGLRQQLLTYKGLLSQNRQALRSTEYQTNTDQEPTAMAVISKDLVYKQTELQLKSAQLQKDIAGLNVQLARIQEASTIVRAPFAGTIEKVFVKPNQFLNPGNPVIKIVGEADLVIEVSVAGEVAARVNELAPASIILNDQVYSATISHVSSVPVDGQLFQAFVSVPASLVTVLQDGQSVELNLPLSTGTTNATYSLVPMEAVFVTNTDTFVFVIAEGIVTKKSIEVGEIIGTVIEVKSGLEPGDVLILDRGVIAGEKVEADFASPESSVQERG